MKHTHLYVSESLLLRIRHSTLLDARLPKERKQEKLRKVHLILFPIRVSDAPWETSQKFQWLYHSQRKSNTWICNSIANDQQHKDKHHNTYNTHRRLSSS